MAVCDATCSETAVNASPVTSRRSLSFHVPLNVDQMVVFHCGSYSTGCSLGWCAFLTVINTRSFITYLVHVLQVLKISCCFLVSTSKDTVVLVTL